MKAVRLIFPSRGSAFKLWLLGHNGRTGVGMVGLFALVLAFFTMFFIALQVGAAQQQIAAERKAIETLRDQTNHVARTNVAENSKSKLTQQQSHAWNQLVRQLNTPWSAILDALEIVTPDSIALVAIEPDARQASIRLQVEAKTLDEVLAYATVLKSVEIFNDILLIKHETNDQDPSKPVRLSLDIRLKAQPR